jgi:hypothetical protein
MVILDDDFKDDICLWIKDEIWLRTNNDIWWWYLIVIWYDAKW